MEIKYIDYQSTADFLDAVAKECLSELTDEDKKILLEGENFSIYHFGIGLYIRNKFIYPQEQFETSENFTAIHALIALADAHSSSIIKKMIALLKE